jgi:multidrug resistance efflux pump
MAEPENPKGGAVADHGDADHTPPEHWSPPARRPATVIMIIVLAILAVIAILSAWRLPPFTSGGPRTDNAYVDGTTTVIAPQVNGTVSRVLVRDYAHVRAGQLLVLIDDSSYRARAMQAGAALDQARAQLSTNAQTLASARAALEGKVAALDAAQADRANAAANLARDNDLVTDGSVSRRERDQAAATDSQAQAAVNQARAAVDIARQDVRTAQVQRAGLEAQVAQAGAQLYGARVDLARTRITAPQDGQLSEVRVRTGALAAPGTQLFTLVPPARWVIANYKERQTHGLRVGQRATFTVDALGGRRFDGFVERIAPATGAIFAGTSPGAQTGNFVKVPQRIGVRIAIPRGQPLAERLRPGMSVETWIDTDRGDGPADHPR